MGTTVLFLNMTPTSNGLVIRKKKKNEKGGYRSVFFSLKYVEDLRFDLLQVLWKSMICSKVYMFAIINLPSHSRNNHFFFPRYMAFQICEANDSLIYIYIYIAVFLSRVGIIPNPPASLGLDILIIP